MSVLRLDKLVESTLGLDKTGIGQLRSVDYAKKYLWEVSFAGAGDETLAPPAPFSDFFPAVDITFDEAALEVYGFEQYMGTYEIPLKTNVRDLSLTFNDSSDNTLFKWLSDWINIDIQNHGHFMSAVQDDHFIVSNKDPNAQGTDSFGITRRVVPLRKMRLKLLSPGKSAVLTRTLLVFPKGKLQYNGTQQSAAQMYSMNFSIVDILNDQAGNDKGAFLDKLKASAVDLFGRFI